MAVDPGWLERVRLANRERFGMAGMGDYAGMGGYPGMGQAGSELVAALSRSKQARVAEEIAKRPPPPGPPPGSPEAVLQALPPIPPPQPMQIPKSVIYLGGALAVGLVFVIGLSLLRRD